MRSLLRNPGWKALAIICAYFSWLAVVEEKQAIRQVEIPLRFENLDPSLALLRDRPSSVVVRVQGAEPTIKELESTDVEARIDLSGFGEGSQLLRLTPDSAGIIPRRPGIKVIEVFPSAFEVQLETKIVSDVPIKVALIGTPAPGYEATEVRVEPLRVRVAGPKSAVERTLEARTREISIEARRTSLFQEVRVDVSNPDVMIMSEPRARVGVTIRELIGERTFADIPIALLGATYESRVTPRQTRITVTGPEVVLADLKRDDLVAYVDLHDLLPQPEEYELALVVTFTRDELRERLSVKKQTPVSVRVYDRKLETAEATTTRGG